MAYYIRELKRRINYSDCKLKDRVGIAKRKYEGKKVIKRNAVFLKFK